MRAVVFGNGGQLGAELARILGAELAAAFTIDEVNVSDYDAAMQSVIEIAPEVVFNAAAATDVDLCETDLDYAYSGNAITAQNLALACAHTGAMLVHVSTDYVFDGNGERAFSEEDAPNPPNAYGRSKLAGERAVAGILPRHLVVRTSWLYDQGGRNFVAAMLRLARGDDPVEVVADQVGTPTYVPDFASGLVRLARMRRFGTFHLTNGGSCSRFEQARAVFELAGFDPERVRPVTSEAFPRPARRPANAVLDNRMVRLAGLPALRHWREALAEAVGGMVAQA
ncbi:MAG: dTDP-4-dehydrorhamnose reductase [Actinomycetota bacterium]